MNNDAGLPSIDPISSKEVRPVWASATIVRYALAGALFGLLFPIISSIIWIYQFDLPWELASLARVQQNNPLQWIIDSAPLFLGIFAGIAGLRQANVIKLNVELEKRITERSQIVNELERLRDSLKVDLERQFSHLQTAAQVASRAAGIRDFEELLASAARLISERFGHYHTGIFLLDARNEFAFLRAASSEGGQRMLARNHRLRVGQQGIVGTVAATGEARNVSDVSQDTGYFENPELPTTRSEAALPLKVRGQIIGVLDVQSETPGAFVRSDLDVLQILADQIALAIDNTRLLKKSQERVQELEKLFRQQTTNTWHEVLLNKSYCYQYTPLGVEKADPATLAPAIGEVSQADSRTARAAITLRGQALGWLVLRREPDQSPWNSDEREIIQAAGVQISQAMENARLLEETRSRARRETILRETASMMRSSFDIQSVLRTAVDEIYQAMNLEKMEIYLQTDGESGTASLPVGGGSSSGRTSLTAARNDDESTARAVSLNDTGAA